MKREKGLANAASPWLFHASAKRAYLDAQSLSAFIAMSASAFVLYTVVPTSFIVSTVGFFSTIEHFSVALSCTT